MWPRWGRTLPAPNTSGGGGNGHGAGAVAAGVAGEAGTVVTPAFPGPAPQRNSAPNQSSVGSAITESTANAQNTTAR